MLYWINNIVELWKDDVLTAGEAIERITKMNAQFTNHALEQIEYIKNKKD